MACPNRFLRIFRRFAFVAAIFFFYASLAQAQQAATVPPASPSSKTDAEFIATADEVLHDMSQITGWDVKAPLKKSIRSRDEIHSYVLRQMDEEKDAKERYASRRSAEAFGLLPRNFDLDGFLVDLLTEQIAGLYDPKAHEFYIADWIAPDEQRMVMSHELTHALEDQHFQIEPWVRAARPNDDAEMAREAVLEGSAMAAMLDYTLKDKHLSLRDLPDMDPSLLVGDLSATPMLKKAPPFIKDSLMFPYLDGLVFSTSVLKADGWNGFSKVFARPPANTQQVLHPDIYRSGKVTAPLKLDLPVGVPDDSWTRLEENSLGEFGWKEVLKQFLDADRAAKLSPAWNGDVYVTYEKKNTTRLLLFARIRLSTSETGAHFFAQYSEALEKKHSERTHLFRRPDFFSFDTPDGGVFLRCFGRECITMEGANRGLFLQWNQKLGWGAIPEEPGKPGDSDIHSTHLLRAY